jgi:flagellar biosynthesis GTPase FlhF
MIKDEKIYKLYNELNDVEIKTHIKIIFDKYVTSKDMKFDIETEKIDDLLKYSVIINSNKIWYLGKYYRLVDLFNRREELGNDINLLKVVDVNDELKQHVYKNERIGDLGLNMEVINNAEDELLKMFEVMLKENVKMMENEENKTKETEQETEQIKDSKEQVEEEQTKDSKEQVEEQTKDSKEQIKEEQTKDSKEQVEEKQTNETEQTKDSKEGSIPQDIYDLNLILSHKLKYKHYNIYSKDLI